MAGSEVAEDLWATAAPMLASGPPDRAVVPAGEDWRQPTLARMRPDQAPADLPGSVS